VTPERFNLPTFQNLLVSLKAKNRQVRLVIDEAHCIECWGDFRDYGGVLSYKQSMKQHCPTLCLTATISNVSIENISRKLGMSVSHSSIIVSKNLLRENLEYNVTEKGQRKSVHIIEKWLTDNNLQLTKGIIFGNSPSDVEKYSLSLQVMGFFNTIYHGSLDRLNRERNHSLWVSGNCKIMIATSAFGMGVDDCEARWVIHTCIPASPTQYL
jgi:superfamily II DNA helicase RecQ